MYHTYGSITTKMSSWKRALAEDGYAIIPNVLDREQATALYNGMWGFWEDKGIMRDDLSTWRDIYKWYPNHGMLFQHWSIGHMQAIWDVRSNPNVKRVFEEIWQTPDLSVSFDGASMGLAPEITNRGWHRKDWLHLDQSPLRSGFECVQGWVTPVVVNEGDASLTVLKGSHLKHAALAKAFNITTRADWCKLTQEQVDWYDCEQVTVTCPSGSMVLWDSRTVHAGRGPIKGRKNPRNRVVAYISMMPNKLLTTPQRLKKQKAILEGRMTTHWAAARVRLFGKNPQTYGKPLPPPTEYTPPHLTPEGAKLAGFDGECPLTIADPAQRKAAASVWLQKMNKPKKMNKKRKL